MSALLHEVQHLRRYSLGRDSRKSSISGLKAKPIIATAGLRPCFNSNRSMAFLPFSAHKSLVIIRLPEPSDHAALHRKLRRDGKDPPLYNDRQHHNPAVRYSHKGCLFAKPDQLHTLIPLYHPMTAAHWRKRSAAIGRFSVGTHLSRLAIRWVKRTLHEGGRRTPSPLRVEASSCRR